MRKDKICTVLLVMVVLLQAIVPAQQVKNPTVGNGEFKATDMEKFKLAAPAKTFEPRYFAATNSKLVPLPTIPFTADEFTKFAPERIVPAGGGVPQVKVRRLIKNKYVLVNVPLDKYVAEVNQYEVFLNKMGYSLRDGKLNKSNPNDTQVQSDLGAILKLRDRKDVESDFNKPLDEMILNPNPFSIFEPYNPKVRDGGAIRVNPGDARRYQTSEKQSPMVIAGGKPVEGNISLDTDAVLKTGTRQLRVATNPTTGFRQVLKVSQGDLPPCVASGPSTSGGVGLNPCQDGGGCADDVKNSTGSSGSSQVNGATFCPGTEKTSNDPKCLFDGSMNTGTVPVLSVNNSATGGKGWFGAFVSVVTSSKIQQDGTKLAINNLGTASAGVTVLGFDQKVLTAESQAQYQSGANPDHSSSSKLFAHTLAGPIPLTSEKEFNFQFFQVVFMAGPVPITISSGLHLFVGLDKQPQPFTAPPLACASTGAGELNMFLGGKVNAELWLEAAVDAIVASAGLDARLILVNDSFGASLKTKITPGTNTVEVTPSMTLKMQHLAGKISLFVELDLLVYSKRWSLTIFESDGIGSQELIAYPKTPKTYVLASKKKS